MQSLRKSLLWSRNRKLACKAWGLAPSSYLLAALRSLTEEFKLSVSAGDIILLESHWYVTQAGLLRVAKRHRCSGISVHLVLELSNPATNRFVFQAIAFRSKTCKGFTGHGDADPSNVSSLVRGAEMRVAETRAVNRALRKAYGIGICSVEEIGSFSDPSPTFTERKKLPPQPVNAQNGDHSSSPKVRDRLCQLIRQHGLDANLVKAYAIDFCGCNTLREASREQVENFVSHLADWAQKDRNALLCQLNSYLPAKEGSA